MHILMILDHEFPPDVRVENEIDTLVKAGHEVHIACYTRKAKPVVEKVNGFTIHRRSISSFIYKSSVASLTLPFYFYFWKKYIADILSTLSFDVIHIHDLPLAGVGVKFRKLHNIRLIIDLHENWPGLLKMSKHTNTLLGRLVSPLFLWRRYEKKVLQHADALIVVVDEAKTRLSDLGIPAGIISVVSNTINPEGLNLPETAHHDDMVLYYAGAINYHRGLQNVILAIHKSKNTRIKFRIVGDGSYKNTLIKLVERLSLKNRVTFYGYQPFKKVMEMLSESDFAIIPHLKSEHTDSTIPHKLFQYMYAGKPVLASDCIPIKRILEETGSGIVFPSGDVEYLSGKLDELESLNYTEMSLNGRKAVTEKYNWNVDGERLVSAYKKLQLERQT